MRWPWGGSTAQEHSPILQRNMDSQDERENSQSHEFRVVHRIEYNQVAGMLWSHGTGSKATFELIAVYMIKNPSDRYRIDEVRLTLHDLWSSLHDLWKVVDEAQRWIDQEMGGPALLRLTQFRVI